MKHERPIWDRMFNDPIYTEIVRIVGYAGLTVREFYQKLDALWPRFDKELVQSAAYFLVQYEGQLTVKPPPLARVMLRDDVRKLAFGLLGPPPEHPWYAAWKSGERIPLPWEKPEPKPEEKPDEPRPEATAARPKRTGKKK